MCASSGQHLRRIADISQLRSRDASAASELQAELDDASDEAIYLKVKLRKNEPIARREYVDVRDRVENIRNRARGDSAGGYTPPPGSINDNRPVSTAGAPPRPPYSSEDRYPNDNTVRSQNPNEIPVSTEFDVRLQNPLSSKTSLVEDRFEATTMVDLRDEHGRVLVPAGSVMRGVVSSVNKATRTTAGQPDGRLRSRHDQRPLVSHPRHGVPGARERRHHGREGEDRHRRGRRRDPRRDPRGRQRRDRRHPDRRRRHDRGNRRK
jgi:hypothetical protein